MFYFPISLIKIALGATSIFAADAALPKVALMSGSTVAPASQMFETLERRLLFSVGAAYSVPTLPSVAVNEDSGWKFKLNPNGSPQASGYDDSSWAAVTLPYTWNGTDAASTNVAGNDGWYRKQISIDATMAGKKLYLEFNAGSIVTSLFIDGAQIDLNPATPAMDSHKGAFQAFAFDVTAALNAAIPAGQAAHVVAVHTNDANNTDIAPSTGGDYSRQGGLYRDVALLAVNSSHIAVTEMVTHAGVGTDTPSPITDSGIQFSNSMVAMGAASATITVKTVLDNLQTARTVNVISYLVDTGGIVRAQSTATQALATSQTGITVAQTATVMNPHLWEGRIDPYLYDLYIEVRDAGSNKLLDLGHQQVGIRSFKINAQPNPTDSNPMNRAAFMLDGLPYRLVGVDMHQDSGRRDSNGHPVGWAQTATQIHADLDLVAAMGATAIRTSHYQESSAFYSYCDQLGIMVYTENSINQVAASTSAFLLNTEDQYNELIRQNYNHPSIFAWGFGNETGQSTNLTNIFTQLNSIAHTLDPGRVTGLGQYGGSNSGAGNTDAVPDIKGTHPYDYWYGPSDVKATHAAYPTQPLGVTEYGGGASAYQYADSFTLPVSGETGGVTTHYHPANQQTRLEELQYTDLSQLNYLWGMFTWQMFDHGSSGKSEGDQGGINDKGLVTRDRVPKDSYYFYEASYNDPSRSWNNQRVLKISDQFWTARNSQTATVTVFSNVGAPTLTLNGVSLGTMTPFTSPSGPNSLVPGTTDTIADTYTMQITLAVGVNSLQVDRQYSDGQNYRDSATWTYRNSVAGTPYAKIDFVGSGQAAASGYSADSGGAFGAHGSQTYGWLPASGSAAAFGSTLTVGSSFGSASSDPAQNGINLAYDPVYKNSSVWQYALPNGTYDVRIGAGQSGASDGVDMFSLEGKTAAIDSNGNNTQDVFFSRVAVRGGKLTVAAAAGAVNARIDFIDINLVSADATPAVISNVVINGGSIQRSVIQNVSLSFNEPVTLGSNAISLSLRGGGTYALTASNPSGDGATYVLALANGNALRTLGDGVYTLNVDKTKVSGGVMAASFNFAFHRLFGDINGDRRVDAQDALLFGLAKGSAASSTNYSSAFDYDGDGDVDSLDALRFKQHLGALLNY